MSDKPVFKVGGYVRDASGEAIEPGRIEYHDGAVMRIRWEASQRVQVVLVAGATEWLTPVTEAEADGLLAQADELSGRAWHPGSGVVHEDYTYILGRKDREP